MASTKRPRPEGQVSYDATCPARSPGPLGVKDQADPNFASLLGDTPGPIGSNDHAGPPASYAADDFGGSLPPLVTTTSSAAALASTQDIESPTEPVSGSILVGTGVASVVRIPVPGTGGLFVELGPRGFVPASGSTSTVFIQDTTGKRHLRLDYGYNKSTGRIDYHWNQKGTHAQFGIPDHAPAGSAGEGLYKGARYLKYGGRVLLVVGIAVDAYSIVVAKKRWRQTAKVLAGWGGAAAGCKLVGAGGAAVGTFVEPGGGTAVGGFLGCIAGGIGGYAGASWAAGEAYDWVEETFFEPLPETSPLP